MRKYDIRLLEAVPPNYYEKGIESNFFQWLWHSWKWRTLSRLIYGFSGKILDVGCAGGVLTAKMQAYLPHVQLTGIDLYQEAIDYASKRYPGIKFVTGDAHRLPFADKSFDAIIAIETLEHLHKPQKALKEIYRVLKPNGIFILGQDTNSFVFKIIWWFWTKSRGKVWQGVHVSCMNPEELSFLLRKTGFLIEKRIFSHLGLEVFFKTRKTE